MKWLSALLRQQAARWAGCNRRNAPRCLEFLSLW